MPELPEVQTIVNRLHTDLIGRKIESADLLWERTLVTPKPAHFKKNIVGQRIDSVNRRAKYIVLTLSVDTLLIHLRMSGDILVRDESTPVHKHDRLILHFDNGHYLAFSNMRKFGRVWLTPNPEDVLGKLGPEPLDDNFTAEMLFERLQMHKRQIKPLLLDQKFLAGMGNIYTDEALHLADLHPLTKSDLIKRKQAEILWRSIRDVLKEGIRRNGTSIDWIYRGGDFQNYLKVYGRANEPCFKCGTPIQKMTVGQRGTHFCPQCQIIDGV
ncbi:MAG: DNA-formamidopyrimidine glycosylase [Anaerolineae bacterium]|jgi:formamidopyrimidine-DNA glycosylase|nr:DNA-formamidopyrimidine glycosylase [Anaerolineae bacterium]MBT3713918.1 DNA-formamidopyrimidine glycosylase [Anaerolineae bacterium]MBT4310660.1 DNA-formamidopyrimidine glycosylase [Anaerolineae bacterium]MBT4459537.1 DNA-formamidopyrimidine glycosylase [Anaerolineae bacterium]MBT4841088.1 DNA-formamidopyrimidine glycosylase [Anaerolineae bacterium]